MKARYNLWIELDGKVIISRWRVRLLDAIDRTGSITAAAEELNVPYRRAWERIHEMEARMNLPLVRTLVGGSRGGGAQLTEHAKDLMHRYRTCCDGLDEMIEERFQDAFKGMG